MGCARPAKQDRKWTMETQQFEWLRVKRIGWTRLGEADAVAAIDDHDASRHVAARI
jgi:hypothetical protein